VSPTTQLIVSALVRRDGRMLLVEEMEHGDPGPTWMLPGGKVEPSETLIQALRRELAEETGMRLGGSPVIAFAIDITAPERQYSAITFDCEADMTDFAGIDPTGPLSYLLDKPAIKAPDNKLGKDAFEKLLVDAKPLSQFLLDELKSRVDLNTHEGRAKLLQDAK